MQGLSTSDAIIKLVELTKVSGRTTQNIEEEITNAVFGAYDFLVENPGFISSVHHPHAKVSKWIDPMSWVGLDDSTSRRDNRCPRLPVNIRKQREAIRKGEGLLAKNSGVDRFKFSYLFAGIDFYIAACIDMKKPAIIRRGSVWLNEIWKMQYIVPNYICDPRSKIELDMGERLYMVVEFDCCTIDEQWNMLAYLEKTNPMFRLIMIVWSGSKSLHGWFTAYGNSEHRCVTFSRRATEIGADKTAYNVNQYVRMPDGINYKNGNRQDIVYFNYDKLVNQIAYVRSECL
jgi:hypothetical protein